VGRVVDPVLGVVGSEVELGVVVGRVVPVGVGGGVDVVGGGGGAGVVDGVVVGVVVVGSGVGVDVDVVSGVGSTGSAAAPPTVNATATTDAASPAAIREGRIRCMAEVNFPGARAPPALPGGAPAVLGPQPR
jgi:hypothetical protein